MLVQFNSPRILCFEEKKIIPGVNDLDENMVARMMDDDIIADKFDRKELEIIGAEDIGAVRVKTKKGHSPTGVDLLLAASDRNALDLAAKTVDLTILDRWIAKEKRVSVRKAIKVQVAKIKNIKYRDKNEKTKLEKAEESESDEG